MISLVVAVSENGVIGSKNGLPWHLPADLKKFKKLTTGHAIVMGRKTWESIGRPLPDRRMLVVTRDPGKLAGQPVEAFASLEAALAAAGEGEIFVIGGGEMYREALPRADRVYFTRVHATIEGDVTFPELLESEWQETFREDHNADERNPHAFTFYTYERRT
ncbi:dihydrofolate reductase [Patescibacteria group bacterium]|nr:MAG: dihydrofolate reductase [Patescibacteria group bacterium]